MSKPNLVKKFSFDLIFNKTLDAASQASSLYLHEMTCSRNIIRLICHERE